MNILFAGFEGKRNTSRLILDELKNVDKIYLINDKNKSTKQIKHAILSNKYDCCILLGQKPLIKNKISIELQAKLNDIILNTSFDIKPLTAIFNKNKIDYYLSKNAGSSYCNNIYFKTMDYITKNELKTKVIFLHLPFRKNFTDLATFCAALKEIK